MLNSSFEQHARPLLERYLGEAGIRLHRVRRQPSRGEPLPDAEFDILLPNGERRRLIVEFKANARRAPLEESLAQLRNHAAHSRASNLQPLIFSSYFGRPMREWLRKQGIWFADLQGNRYFRGPGLLVDREVGEKPKEIREPSASVFADRSSLVLRYLIPRPPVRIGVRDLARRVGLSPAAVSQCMKRLRELGHIGMSSDQIRLQDREGLLAEWVSFYRPRFRRQPQSRYYVHARSAEAVVDLLRSVAPKDHDYALSIHAGASLVAPYVQFREVHLYVPSAVQRLRSKILKSLGGEEAVSEANLIFIDPFYKDSFRFDARAIRGIRVVSDLQLYLDLSCFPQRGSEQAEIILERRLRPGWTA